MKRRKHQFHCEKCGSPCEIYKKGRKHRVLICPNCGVLATNPLPLIAGAALKLGGSLLASKAIEKISGGGKKAEGTPTGKTTYDSLDKPNKGERYVNIALGR